MPKWVFHVFCIGGVNLQTSLQLLPIANDKECKMEQISQNIEKSAPLFVFTLSTFSPSTPPYTSIYGDRHVSIMRWNLRTFVLNRAKEISLLCATLYAISDRNSRMFRYPKSDVNWGGAITPLSCIVVRKSSASLPRMLHFVRKSKTSNLPCASKKLSQ